MNDVYYTMFDKITLSDEKMHQILQLNENSRFIYKRHLIQKKHLGFIACAMLLLFIAFEPTRVYANKFFHELVALISVNETDVELAQSEWLPITMPEDVQEKMFEGTLYQYKSYHSLVDLEKDLDIDLLDFECDYDKKNNQVCFQVENHSAASINMLIDNCGEGKTLPISYTVYFSTAKGKVTGHLKYKEKNSSYLDYDDNGEERIFYFDDKYEIVESYKSTNLNTDVLILEAIEGQRLGEQQNTKSVYYVIFVHDKKEYVLCFDTDLDNIKHIVEMMK